MLLKTKINACLTCKRLPGLFIETISFAWSITINCVFKNCYYFSFSLKFINYVHIANLWSILYTLFMQYKFFTNLNKLHWETLRLNANLIFIFIKQIKIQNKKKIASKFINYYKNKNSKWKSDHKSKYIFLIKFLRNSYKKKLQFVNVSTMSIVYNNNWKYIKKNTSQIKTLF